MHITDALGYRWQYTGPVMICGVTPSPDGGAAGSSGGGGGTGAPSSTPSAPAAPSTPAAAPASTPATIDWSTAPEHFRTAYEKLKGDHETFSKEWGPLKEVGAPGDLQRGYTVANKMYQEMTTLATAQGYAQQDIDEAFDKDPVGTLAFLRAQAAKAGKGGADSVNPDGTPKTAEQIQKMIKDGIDQATAPLNDWHNKQLTEAANNRFDAEYNRVFTDAFKQYGDDIPKELRQDLYDITSELMKFDTQALDDLKTKGSVAAVAKYFGEAQKLATRIYTHMAALEGKRTGGGAGRGPDGKFAGSGGGAPKKVSLDDIISGKAVDDRGHIRA